MSEASSVRAPDGMMIRRSAFDFLQKKSIIPRHAVFSPSEASAELFPCGSSKLSVAFVRWQGAELIFDSDCNVRQYGLGKSRVARCQEPLDISSRRDALAYPTERYDHGKQKASPTTQQQQEQDPFEILPETALLHIASFAATMQNVFPLTRVNKHWRRVMNETTEGDQILWKGMCLAYYPVLQQVKEAMTDDDDDDNDSVTWKELFHHRAKHLKALFTPNDEDGSIERHSDLFRNGPFKPEDFNKYRPAFTIDIWKGDEEQCTRVQVTKMLLRGGVVKLELPSATLADCTALDIYVHPSKGSSPALLYSGGIGSTDDAYNRFDKFRARSFLIDIHREDFQGMECAPIAIPTVIPVVKSGANNKSASSVELQLLWQTSHNAQEHWIAMDQRDALVFLQKGLVSGNLPPPPTTRSIVANNWALTRYSSRPLSSYGFVVDYLLNTEEAEPCVRDITSCFYDSLDFIQASQDPRDPEEFSWPALKFNIPPGCLSMIPTFQSFQYTGEYLEAVVYVVDKASGMHAKLFQGTPCGFDQEGFDGRGRRYFILGDKDDFDAFAVATFFAGNSDESNNWGSYPVSSGRIYRDAGSAQLVVDISANYEAANSGTSLHLGEEAFLAFLDKGLSWGKATPGHRRGNHCPGF